MGTSMKSSERSSAIHLLRSGRSAFEVAQQLGKSLAWVYKWRRRFFEHQNWDDLQDRSRAPTYRPTEIAPDIRQAVKEARSELEAEAVQPKKLSYIGSHAIRYRLKQKGIAPLPSRASIDRILSTAGMTRPRKPKEVKVRYPHLHPTQPHQLIQVDIVPRYLPGGGCVSCFNAIDVVSRYPTGWQALSKRSQDALRFLLQVLQEVGLAEYIQLDNESCFSGGFTHPGVIGKVVRCLLLVGVQPVFSPFYLPESNYAVERFHQDYLKNTWEKEDMPDLASVQANSALFYPLYRQSGHHSALEGLSPAEVHVAQPRGRLPKDFALPKGKLPITEGKVHYIRRVAADHTICVANLGWKVSQVEVGEGVWTTLEITRQSAKLSVFDAAPDAREQHRLAVYPFPLKEPVQPLSPEFQNPLPMPSVEQERSPVYLSTMS